MAACRHNNFTVQTVKNGKDKITYLKCNDCGAVLPK